MDFTAKLANLNLSLNTQILDADDINGPGTCSFPQTTGDLSVDFSLFKTQKFALSADIGERLNFVKSLG